MASQKAILEWKEKLKARSNDENGENENADDMDEDNDVEYGLNLTSKQNPIDDPMGTLAPRFTAHVPVPTQKDIEAALLRKKKQELLVKYGIGED